MRLTLRVPPPPPDSVLCEDEHYTIKMNELMAKLLEARSDATSNSRESNAIQFDIPLVNLNDEQPELEIMGDFGRQCLDDSVVMVCRLIAYPTQ